MDARSFAQVALRLMAVLLIFIGLADLSGLVVVLTDHGVPRAPSGDIRLYFVSLIFPMVLGLVLWMISSRLARWIVGKDEGSGSFVPLDVSRFQTVAFVVLGAWLAIKALSGLLVIAANSQWEDPRYWERVTELVLSICLIVGARFLARVVGSIRQFGAEQDQK